jgi:hypothetical protein
MVYYKLSIKVMNIFAALCAILISGCSTSSPKVPGDLQESFQQLVGIEDINKSLQVIAEISDNKIMHFGSQIHTVIKNASNQLILIRAPEGIRLFIINDGKWLEINDNNEYFGDGEGAVLYPSGPLELRGRKSTWVSPVLKPGTVISDPDSNIVLRILILGEQISDDKKTGLPIGAYTDVYLVP